MNNDTYGLLTEFCRTLHTLWRIFGRGVPPQIEVSSADFSFELVVSLNMLFNQVEVDFWRVYDRSGFHFHYSPNDTYTFGDETVLRDVCSTVDLTDFLRSLLCKYLSYVTDLIKICEILCQEGFLDLGGSVMFVI